jgi:hypothetical protein
LFLPNYWQNKYFSSILYHILNACNWKHYDIYFKLQYFAHCSCLPSMYRILCYTPVKIAFEEKQLWRHMATHSKANVVLMPEKVKGFDQTYKSCEMVLFRFTTLTH